MHSIKLGFVVKNVNKGLVRPATGTGWHPKINIDNKSRLRYPLPVVVARFQFQSSRFRVCNILMLLMQELNVWIVFLIQWV